MQITFITSNAAKAQQVSDYLKHPVIHKKLALPEIQSLDLHEIVMHKAKTAYELIKMPVLVEDVSLVFTALGKLPGPLIRWFLEELSNEGLCKLVLPEADRSAIASISYALYDGQTVRLFDGQMKGSVALRPQGRRAFGWDPIFIPHGSQKSWSQMTPEEYQDISMRRIALAKLHKYLQRQA